MKTRNFVLLIVAFIVLIVLVFSIKHFVKSKKKDLSNFEEYIEYISAYTSGSISKNSEVLIELNSGSLINNELSEDQLQELLEFEPKIKGKVFWKKSNTLAFKPEKPFEYSQRYYVTFKISKLLINASKIKDFVFTIFIVPQSFNLEHYTVNTISNDYSLQSVSCLLRLSESEKKENIEKCVNVKINSSPLPFKLITNDNITYQIIVDSIKRTDNLQFMKIICDGKHLGIETKAEKEIEIPPVSEFKLLDVFTNQYPEQNIHLVFSDPIDSKQDLGGIISLNPEVVLRYTIDKNNVILYPSEFITGNYQLSVLTPVLNTKFKKLKEQKILNINFYDIKPKVLFADDGFIIPTSSQGNFIPILTMNLKEIDIRIIKIFENNVLQFLQVNNFDGQYELKRVGKVIYKGTIPLNVTNQDKNNWKRFNIDISKYIKADPGSIYRISLGFRQHQTLLDCNQNITSQKANIDNSFDYFDYDYYSYYDYYDEYDYEDYWENRDNPCHKSYYGASQSVSKNIYASDIALIAKKTPNNNLYVFASDIKTAEPFNGVEIEIYDYAKQLLGKAITDAEGKALFNIKEEPYFVVAKKIEMKSYLKLNNELSLSMVSFDISGQNISNGLNGFIYTERGVWRPGDSIYISFILQEDKSNPLPAKQPIIFELFDPSRNLIKKQVLHKNVENIYIWRTATSTDAQTGNYQLQVKVGASVFTKNLKIETVKPNRLKINLSSKNDLLTAYSNNELYLKSEWLHGAPASNLKAQVDMILKPITTQFKGYESYVFDDISKKYYSEEINIFNDLLDDKGNATIRPKFNVKEEAPGFMKAIFTTKVFEKGGEFSIDQTTFMYSPYKTYVGFSIKEDYKDYGILYTDKDHFVNIVALDSKGNLENKPCLVEVLLYKLDWRWWWDQTDEYLDLNYRGHSYLKLVKSDTLATSNGKTKWSIKIDKNNYGRYLLYVKDLEGKHSSSKIIYFDWPEWKTRISDEREQTSTQLVFTTDKENYNVDEEVIVSFPGGTNGRALISLENSKGIIQYNWVKTVNGINTYRFKTTSEMSPNVYISITLIQSYNKIENDKPLRLYGLRNIMVENPESRLNPLVQVPNEFKSENTYQITVSEKNGKEMYYTLALVDEGLLSLTRFKTPNPWQHFYSKESYLFTQWDMFNYFIKGLTGKLSNVIGIGGDEGMEAAIDAIEALKSKRFKPMVIFEGTHYLKPGKKNTHKIKIPNYMGEVRLMLIARYNNAYGNYEKSIKVIKPIVCMASLPRTLSVEDEVSIPVSVFSYNKNIKNAVVSISAKGPVTIIGKNQQNVVLEYNSDKTVFFVLKADKIAGMASVEVKAQSGNEVSTQTIDIYVRNPNPFTTQTKDWVIEAGNKREITIQPFGVNNTNYATIEVSAIPPLNLEKHINFLTTYPHGCLEQIVSSAFPQLYLTSLIDLPLQRINEISYNIKNTIQRIIKYQTYSGGFSYWPGNQDVEDWVTSYCGHFLLEAQKAGYIVPSSVLTKWKKYQKTAAQKWYNKGPSSQYVQAYRLYTLALNGNADFNSMNRLYSEKNLTEMAIYPLAASYALTGRYKIANQLISNAKFAYTPLMFYDIYGSEMREKAFIAISYTTMNNRIKAFTYIKDISKMLTSNNWYSTQSLAFALIACSNYLQGEKLRTPMKIEYNLNQKNKKSLESTKYFYRIDIDNANVSNTLRINNLSNFPIYVQTISKGVLPLNTENNIEKGIGIDISYVNYEGNRIDYKSLKQTENLFAVIQVKNQTNNTHTRLALTYSIPSGWEILNDRILETESNTNSIYDFKDIRDDKVNYYFSLGPNQMKTFKIPVNATFAGKFYHPAVICEDMYNYDVRAQIKGEWIEVQKTF